MDEDLILELQEEVAEERESPDDVAITLERLASEANIAESLDEQELKVMATQLCEYIEQDNDSRTEWLDRNQDYLKLAVQVSEEKSFPWPNASNVKYPLLTTAAMQFQSRCYKALINGSRPVRTRVIGNDKLGLKKARANRISEHMSYQLLEEMPNWEEHMDTLCMVVPVSGNAYKKTFYDGEAIKSELVLPQDLIVNFYARSIEEAPRKTHVIPMTKNELLGYERSGYYSAIDFDKLSTPDGDLLADESALLEGQGLSLPEDDQDPTIPYKVYECHCWWDLDEDGYSEPYIVTLLEKSKQIVRITPRFGPNDVVANEDGEVIRINAIELFTNYRFIPDPRSGVYGLGFGHILGPINEATNTLINQIIDAGTMSNMPSGWLARGARMQSGTTEFRPGEWKVINTMGDDLRKSVVPIPAKEPSAVLFNLLGLFVEAGQTLASVTDMMQGKNPGQNQPFSTTSAVLEQGMAVYSTIFKRMHRSFKRELKKIYRLNKLYLPPEVYFNIIDPETGEDETLNVTKSDYERDTTDVVPNSDPENVSSYQKLADAELLFNLMQTGAINPKEAVKRILEARGIEDMMSLLEMPPPQPDPEIVLKEKELALREKEIVGQQEIDRYKAQYQAARDQAASVAKLAEAQLAQADRQLNVQKETFKQMLDRAKLELEQVKVELEAVKAGNEQANKQREMENKQNEQNASGTTGGA